MCRVRRVRRAALAEKSTLHMQVSGRGIAVDGLPRVTADARARRRVLAGRAQRRRRRNRC
eukprot:7288008-Prymnesium_polylepis.1